MLFGKPTIIFDHLAIALDRLSHAATHQNGTNNARSQGVSAHILTPSLLRAGGHLNAEV
jgi:hypothetical protein